MLNDFELDLGRQVCNAVRRNISMNEGIICFIEIEREKRWRDKVIRINIERSDFIALQKNQCDNSITR